MWHLKQVEWASASEGMEKAIPRREEVWQTEQFTRECRAWLNFALKLFNPGNRFIAPVSAFV